MGEAPTEARPKDAVYLDRSTAGGAASPKAAPPNGTVWRNGDARNGAPESPSARETEAERKNRVGQRPLLSKILEYLAAFDSDYNTNVTVANWGQYPFSFVIF